MKIKIIKIQVLYYYLSEKYVKIIVPKDTKTVYFFMHISSNYIIVFFFALDEI